MKNATEDTLKKEQLLAKQERAFTTRKRKCSQIGQKRYCNERLYKAL